MIVIRRCTTTRREINAAYAWKSASNVLRGCVDLVNRVYTYNAAINIMVPQDHGHSIRYEDRLLGLCIYIAQVLRLTILSLLVPIMA